jgi:signal transduction histidine kinase
MKRLSLATKLALAVLPIALIALVAGAFSIWVLVEAADGSTLPVSGIGLTPETTMLIGALIAVVFLAALWAAYSVGRSVVRRIRAVTAAATKVADVDLPNLVDALRSPHQDHTDLPPPDLEEAGFDEVGDLARSFAALHATLVEVASQQMEILRRGVSEIFVTLARRNRSLVDRQLALIDELEAREEDPEILGGYYKLDHFSTRMRRNAESLLVLAGTEPPRVWAKPLEISEVIRGALGEVDDYQRIDVLALEPARLSGSAVADVAHLLSEILDNATQYSAPTERVRVAGMFDPEGYLLTVSDSGLGMSEARLGELNRILEQPPALGLALEPTLGMYVVARLAARHGIKARLIAGVPGLTVRVTIPRGLLEVSRPAHAAPGDADTPVPGFDVANPDPFGGQTSGLEPDESVAASAGETQYVFRRNGAAGAGSSTEVVGGPAPATVVARPETAPKPLIERAPVPKKTAAAFEVSSPVLPAPVTPTETPNGGPKVPVTPHEMQELTRRLRRESAEQAPGQDGAGRNGASGPGTAPAELPTRTPGAAFQMPEDDAPSSVTADGAMGIRSALSAFDEGRKAASTSDGEPSETGDARPAETTQGDSQA